MQTQGGLELVAYYPIVFKNCTSSEATCPSSTATSRLSWPHTQILGTDVAGVVLAADASSKVRCMRVQNAGIMLTCNRAGEMISVGVRTT